MHTSKLLIAVAMVVCVGAHGAKADMNFESLSAPGDSLVFYGPTYSEGGNTVTNLSDPGPFASTFSRQTGAFTFAGSTSLTNNIAGGITRLTDDSATPFSLFSIDLAEHAHGTGFNVPVTFTPTYADSTPVIPVTFQLDGINLFSTNGNSGFETFTFPATWTNLVHVDWGQAPQFHQFDNIIVTPIPAPGAALLAMLGLPMIGWAKRRFV